MAKIHFTTVLPQDKIKRVRIEAAKLETPIQCLVEEALDQLFILINRGLVDKNYMEAKCQPKKNKNSKTQP